MDKQFTSETSVSKTKQEIIKEAKRIEESTLFSSKGHFVAARIWTNFHFIVGIPIVTLAAVAASLSKLNEYQAAAGILSIVVAALSAVQTFLNPNDRSSRHLNAGNNYDALQNKVRVFWTIECWQDNSDKALTEKVKEFSNQKEKINHSSPQVPYWAYKIAKSGILAGEASYQVDKET